jgi:hypothetical protein
MWVEVKIFFSIIGNVFIAIVLSQIILFNMVLGMLLFMAMGIYVMGDMLICYQIKHNHVDKLIDPCPQGKELGVMFTLTGLLDFIWATKKPHGKREFVYHGEEASYINNGNYPIHTMNGNYGAIAHESHDENISLFEAKAAERISEDFNTKDIKEVYIKAKKMEENNDEEN